MFLGGASFFCSSTHSLAAPSRVGVLPGSTTWRQFCLVIHQRKNSQARSLFLPLGESAWLGLPEMSEARPAGPLGMGAMSQSKSLICGRSAWPMRYVLCRYMAILPEANESPLPIPASRSSALVGETLCLIKRTAQNWCALIDSGESSRLLVLSSLRILAPKE